MIISIIGPGIMTIPPFGWGAVESLIWDYKCLLEKCGHDVLITNELDPDKIVEKVNLENPDFIHIQYDKFINIVPELRCDKIAITSHYAYLDSDKMGNDYRDDIFHKFIEYKDDIFIFCLSNKIRNFYIKHGIDELGLFLCPNGARGDLFKYDNNCKFKDRSICLAKVENRKRQNILQKLNINIDFAGVYQDSDFDLKDSHFLGEWKKEQLYESLTNYANLVLLSDGEADPLVTKEALMSGLGLVISEYCGSNLDLSLPFIEVIPESRINDDEYTRKCIIKNRDISIRMRDEIRKYALENLDWEILVKRYIKIINECR